MMVSEPLGWGGEFPSPTVSVISTCSGCCGVNEKGLGHRAKGMLYDTCFDALKTIFLFIQIITLLGALVFEGTQEFLVQGRCNHLAPEG